MEINGYVVSFLLSHKVENSELQAVLSGVLLGRLVSFYQAVYLLACRGIAPAAHSLMRAMMEAHLILHYVSKSSACADAFVLSETHDKLRDLKKLARYPEKRTAEELQQIQDWTKILNDRKTKEKSPVISTRNMAEATGREREYDSTYSHFCTHLHARPGSLSEALVLDDDHKIRNLKWGPHHKGMNYVLATSMSVMLEALTAQNFAYFVENSPEYVAFMKRVGMILDATKEEIKWTSQNNGDRH